MSDHQIIVTTCINAALERDKLIELYNYKSVIGLPYESHCVDPEDYEDDYRLLSDDVLNIPEHSRDLQSICDDVETDFKDKYGEGCEWYAEPNN